MGWILGFNLGGFVYGLVVVLPVDFMLDVGDGGLVDSVMVVAKDDNPTRIRSWSNSIRGKKFNSNTRKN